MYRSFPFSKLNSEDVHFVAFRRKFLGTLGPELEVCGTREALALLGARKSAGDGKMT